MKILCIGRNYKAHAEELGNAIPQEPVLFMKPPSALLISNKPFYIPEFTNDVHYEAEIVIKIMKNGRHVQPQFAGSYFEEIAFGIDFTARDVQSKLKAAGLPWEKSKAFDHSAAISEFIPLKPDWRVSGVPFSLLKNDQEVQSGCTANMLFSFEEIICHCSKYFKLQIGDLIYTGTPAGVGGVMRGDVLDGYINNAHMLRCAIK